jgi:hypothetical protein
MRLSPGLQTVLATRELTDMGLPGFQEPRAALNWRGAALGFAGVVGAAVAAALGFLAGVTSSGEAAGSSVATGETKGR